MTFFGRKTTPRALIWVPDDALADRLAQHFPHSVRVEGPGSTQENEFDVVITTEGLTTISPAPHSQHKTFSPHLYVLAFGGEDLGAHLLETPRGSVRVPVTRTQAQSDREFATADERLPAGVAELVRRDLAPQALGRETHTAVGTAGGSGFRSWVPFLMSTSGMRIAGMFERGREGAAGQCWTLPEDVRLHAEWLLAALRHWRTREPDRFVRLPGLGWEREDSWLTAEEAPIKQALDDLQAERTNFLANYEEDLARLETELAAARGVGATGARRLLTADSDELVAEVRTTLELMGFVVYDVDADVAAKGEKVEDLRVEDPEQPGWIALAEVKSYGGGAKVNDLLKIAGRFVVRFAAETGRSPDGTWFIANTFRGADPSMRPPMLASDEAVLTTFAEGGGLVIDTANLFRLRRQVELGHLGHAEARRILRKSTGRLEYA
jgi:hypothetical protein